MADFVAVPFGTVNHEHGERRQIQNLRNNLKSSSGIERIPFNGIDELDTEQGANGEVVYALSSGDSRIRFIDGVETWQFFASANAGGSQPGAVVQVASTGAESLNNSALMGSVEITFFGTALNILSFSTVQPTNWLASVDGGTPTQVSPNNNTVNLTQSAQLDNINNVNNKTKVNQVVPIVSGLAAGVHTVKIDGHRHGINDSGTGGTEFPLFGCEIINENADITQQPGADFDGRVELLTGSSFPIEPTAATSGTAYRPLITDVKTGARVLNYLTSGGQLKQSFNFVNEAPGALGASTTRYTILINNGGSTSVTIPTGVLSFTAHTFGAGGGGGGGFVGGGSNTDAQSGGGGGGGGLATSIYTRDTDTNAVTLALTIDGDNAGGTGFGGNGTAGGDTVIQVSSADLLRGRGGALGGGSGAFTAGGGGNGGGFVPGDGNEDQSTNITNDLTGWTTNNSNVANGTNGTNGIAAGAGGTGGPVGGDGNFPLTGTEGGTGQTPGGGGTGGPSNGAASTTGGVGRRGRVYLVFTSTSSSLTNTSFGITAAELTDTTTTTGISLGAPTAVFGISPFDDFRLDQEVIRRINFREFGVNDQFATLGTGQGFTAFTLDDGTTTLSGNGVVAETRNGIDTVLTEGTDDFFTLTFVGTGLDIFEAGAPNGTTVGNAQPVAVDGLSVGNYIPSTLPQVTPIVSGLAYGTHTVRFANASGGAAINPNVVDFIIYGPKKPEIPTLDEGSLELSDYNIMADFAADTSNNINSMSKGILGKAVARECIIRNGVSGTSRWNSESSTDGSNYGSRLNETGDGTILGQDISYTFYGDAFSMRMKSSSTTNDSSHQFFLDGTQITRTNAEGWDVDEIIFLNNTEMNSSDPSQAWPATGDIARFTGTDTTKIIFPPSFNMGLGVHTIRIRHAVNFPGVFYGMEIGTPIHINEDTLKIGSEGLNNLTIDPVVEEDEQQVLANLGEAKAWLHYSRDNPTSTILGSYNISAIVQNSTSTFTVFLDKPFKDKGYAVLATARDNGSSTNVQVQDEGPSSSTQPRPNFFTINCEQAVEGFYIACFGELIDE